MAAVRYTKGDRVAEADIQQLPGGIFQGVVLMTYLREQEEKQSLHTVASVSDTPQEALDEAKALAHRILAEEEA